MHVAATLSTWRLAVERLIHNPLLLIDLLNHNQSQEIWGRAGLS